MNTPMDPLNKSIPYIESNFELGFLSSILHTFILIFFAELGDKTFIMLFILQLRTNKVTIFYSALLAEILMNSLACFSGTLINYLLYKNLIDYIGILFFAIYGIFLILCGFKTTDETFEIEFEMIEEMIKKKNRTSLMILGVDESENNKNKEEDKYNLEDVNIVNEKIYVPNIKKELTIIPEDDISREDSIASDGTTMLLSGKKQKNNNEDDNDFFLGNKDNDGFNLKLRKPKKQKTKEKNLGSDKNIIETVNKINNNINTDTNNINNEENNNEKDEDDDNNIKKGKMKYKSRYYLDYFDKNVDTNNPNIDTSIFGTIFFTICISEFGDRTQLISLTTGSIFHFWGSLLGSCTALFCSCLIGVYFTKPIVKKLKQKFIDFVLGILFLILGFQIYICKMINKTTI